MVTKTADFESAEQHANQSEIPEYGRGYRVREVGPYATAFAFGGMRGGMAAATGRIIMAKPDIAIDQSYPSSHAGPENYIG
jgi:hypothetical protein